MNNNIILNYSVFENYYLMMVHLLILPNENYNIKWMKLLFIVHLFCWLTIWLISIITNVGHVTSI